MSEQWEEFIPQYGETWPIGFQCRYHNYGQDWSEWESKPSFEGVKISINDFGDRCAFRRPLEAIPLRLCVDLLMENVRTINEFRHLAIPNQGLIILGHFVISDTSYDLRTKVEQAVREMAKGGQ